MGALNVAVTEVLPEGVKLHAAVPLQAPDHPENIEFPVAAAVSVTAVPVAKVALQVWPQLMPVGLLLTVPAPVPEAVTLTRTDVGEWTCDDPQPEKTHTKDARQNEL